MKLERRMLQTGDGQVLRGVVAVVESPEERKILGELFGTRIEGSGLISIRECECRVGGMGEYYLYFPAGTKTAPPPPDTVLRKPRVIDRACQNSPATDAYGDPISPYDLSRRRPPNY